jgi:hypothetical protein
MRADDVKEETPTMTDLDPNIFGALSVAAGLGFAMVWLAARVSMIELRRPTRCPACGRLRRAGSCGCNV